MPLIDSGTVDSTGAGTFTDTSQTWTAGEHIGRVVKNTTTNKSGGITGNTTDTITTTVAFTATDTYEILEIPIQVPEDEDEPIKRRNLEDNVMELGTESDRVGREYGVD